MKYGFPCALPLLLPVILTPLARENLRFRSGYVMSYSNKHRTANWVCEVAARCCFSQQVLTPDRMATKAADRKKSEFKVDESIHPFFRSTNADYK